MDDTLAQPTSLLTTNPRLIVDVLIEERAPRLAGSWAWPLVRPPLFAALHYGKARAMADAIARMGGRQPLDHVSDLLALKVEVRAAAHPRPARLGDQAIPSFSGKRMQDTRDTCITRLWMAKVPLDRMWSWTGHSKDGIEEILRKHYLVLREDCAREMALQLETWASAAGVGL